MVTDNWIFRMYGTEDNFVRSQDGWGIAEIYSGGVATGNLIAAAPKLRDALVLLLGESVDLSVETRSAVAHALSEAGVKP